MDYRYKPLYYVELVERQDDGIVTHGNMLCHMEKGVAYDVLDPSADKYETFHSGINVVNGVTYAKKDSKFLLEDLDINIMSKSTLIKFANWLNINGAGLQVPTKKKRMR